MRSETTKKTVETDVPQGVLDRTKSIVRVGQGRGFVVEYERLSPGLKADSPVRVPERFVITAATVCSDSRKR